MILCIINNEFLFIYKRYWSIFLLRKSCNSTRTLCTLFTAGMCSLLLSKYDTADANVGLKGFIREFKYWIAPIGNVDNPVGDVVLEFERITLSLAKNTGISSIRDLTRFMWCSNVSWYTRYVGCVGPSKGEPESKRVTSCHSMMTYNCNSLIIVLSIK